MTAIEPQVTPPALEETLVHWHCCRDDTLTDQTFCGSPPDNAGEDDEPNCVVCIDLDQRGVCPITGVAFNCDGRCPGPEEARSGLLRRWLHG